MNLKIVLPAPRSELSTNKTKGAFWANVAKKRKEARKEGYFLAIEALRVQKINFTCGDRLQLNIKVYSKNKRRMDDDNILSALKSYRDGIFDALFAYFSINDRQITLTIIDVDLIDLINPRTEWELMIRI